MSHGSFKPKDRKWFDPILLAPLIFVCHFLEEAPTFVPWFNAHVTPDITAAMFWRVNLTGLVITLIVVALEWFSRSSVSLVLVVAWFGLLMLANAIFHIAAAVVDRSYIPGLVTAALLYLPYYLWLFVRSVKRDLVRMPVLIGAAIIGATPMCAHGYLIVFRGSRLF
jgi:uncharacterized protein with HXXEE motif